MLTLYRRHLADCPHQAKGRQFRRCRCPIWIQGTVEGKPVRRSLDVTSWERAEELKSAAERPAEGRTKAITIEAALESFVGDCEARNLNRSTIAKYRALRANLAEFCGRRGFRLLPDLDPAAIREFQRVRALAPRTAAKELERVRAFFGFCIDSGWAESSPARKVKAPQTDIKPVEPFSREEQSLIVETAYRLSATGEAADPRSLPVNPKTGTFARLLLLTGMRITNAAALTKADVRGDRIITVTQKRRRTVAIRIPPELAAELAAIADHELFRSPAGSRRPETVSDYWRDQLIKVFRAAGIEGGHPHRFRHSLAVNMLSTGSSVEDVAAVLGNSPAIVAEHYSAWVTARQQRLDGQMEKAWRNAD